MKYISSYDSPLGAIVLESDGEALTGLRFAEQPLATAQGLQPKEPAKQPLAAAQGLQQKEPAEQPLAAAQDYQPKELPIFAETRAWLAIYFSGKEPTFTPKLALRGTEFRMAVWRLLLQLPYGQAVTYGEIARLIAKERAMDRLSAQAVGGAVGHNPIAILVPCHRVLGAKGRLTGYAGGLDKKVGLLRLEKISFRP